MLEDDPDAAFIAGADAPVAEADKPAEADAPSEETKTTEAPEGETTREAEPKEKAEAEPEGEEPKGAEETDRPKQTPWFQKRIDQVTREKHEALRRAEGLEQQMRALLEAVQAQQPAPEGDQPAAPAAAPGQPPVLPQNMTAAQIRAEAERIVAADNEKKAVEAFNRTCNEIYDQGAKAFKGDWQETVATLGTALPAGITRDLVDAAIEAGDPHKLFYHLGKHPEVAQEIAELTPARMAVRLAKIAGDLNKPAAPRPVSKAPEPVKPFGGGSATAETDPEKMTTEQWMAWHDSQQEKRRRRA